MESRSNDIVLWQNYYIYKKVIGSGSYSKVYRAIDSTTNEYVAIKKINKDSISKNLIDRFLKEIEILKSINHPNVITFKNSVITDKYIFIITELCDGGSVKDLIQKGLTENEVQSIIHQLVKAMNYLDSINILHRDIKPDNLLLTKNNILKIIDFGFSYQNKMSNDMYKTICGTPMYMSPELLSGKPYSKKSDLWSLGIIAYELFHCKNPYGKPRNIQELIYAINTYKILYRDDISNHFLDFLKNLLIIDPNDRLDYDNLLNHVWFTSQITNNKNIDDIFSMDDLEIPKTNIKLLTSSQIIINRQPKIKTIDYPTIDESDCYSFKSDEIDYNNSLLNDSMNSTTNSINEDNQNNIIHSKPIDIINRSKNNVNIIENFFEKPNTLNENYLGTSSSSNSSSIGSMNRKYGSDSILQVPIRIIKSIIRSASNSPLSDTLNTINSFSPF